MRVEYVCVTCLVARMPPQFELQMPSWLKWKRHTWSIKTTTDNEMWLKAIGLQALKDNGASDAASSQLQLLATRVLTIVRQQQFSAVRQDLAALFKTGTADKDLSEEATEFWDAMVIFLHRRAFKLARRIALLTEARAFAKEESTSPLMSALCASPRGREVLDEAYVHLEDCKKSNDQLAVWQAALDRGTLG